MQKSITRRFWRYQIPFWLWAFLILITSAVPADSFPDFGPWWMPKFIHVVFYFIFSMLAYRALTHQVTLPWLRRFALPVALGLAVFYAVLDEAHQLFVEGRTARVSDIALDMSSACLFAVCYWVSSSLRRKQNGRPAS